MMPKGFVWLSVPGIQGYEGLAFHRIDDEVIELPDIIGGISNKEGAFFELEKPFEVF